MKRRGHVPPHLSKASTIDSERVADLQGNVIPNILSRILERESEFHAFLQRRVPDNALAKDLLQQSFLRAVQQQHQVRNPDQIVSWFYRILRNTIVDYYRTRDSHNRKVEAFMQELIASESDKTPVFNELRPAVCVCLELLLPTLRPGYATLLNRIDLNGESMASVAKDLGVTPNTLTVRLHRARQALRKSLEERCGICTKHGCLNCTCT